MNWFGNRHSVRYRYRSRTELCNNARENRNALFRKVAFSLDVRIDSNLVLYRSGSPIPVSYQLLPLCKLRIELQQSPQA